MLKYISQNRNFIFNYRLHHRKEPTPIDKKTFLSFRFLYSFYVSTDLKRLDNVQSNVWVRSSISWKDNIRLGKKLSQLIK